jgi:hypothetical protein
MPVEDLMCYPRDVEAEAAFNRDAEKHFAKYWQNWP